MAQTLSDARSAKLVDCLPANQTVRFDSVRFGWVWFFCHAKRCSGTGSGAAGVARAARVADNGIAVGSQLSNVSSDTYTAATLSAAHSNCHTHGDKDEPCARRTRSYIHTLPLLPVGRGDRHS